MTQKRIIRLFRDELGYRAGNDSERSQYGAIGTPEKYFLKWKEDARDNTRFKELNRLPVRHEEWEY